MNRVGNGNRDGIATHGNGNGMEWRSGRGLLIILGDAAIRAAPHGPTLSVF